MGLHQHRAVLCMGAGGVQAHLEVLVVHVDMVEGEFHVAEHAHPPWPVRRIADAHVEDFHGVAAVLLPGDEQRLPGGKPLIVAGEGGIAQPVAAFIACPVQGKPRGLPAQRPAFAALVIPQVDVVPGKIEGHAVGPEAGDAVVLGRIQPAVAPGVVGNHRAHALGAQVVGHGKGSVGPVDDIFPGRIVKIAVSHGQVPSCFFSTISISEIPGKKRPLHVIFCL